MIERKASYRGRTTPEVEWRVWNADHTSYMTFKTKREALAYDGVSRQIQRNADRIDGYDRDDLGESPDY